MCFRFCDCGSGFPQEPHPAPIRYSCTPGQTSSAKGPPFQKRRGSRSILGWLRLAFVLILPSGRNSSRVLCGIRCCVSWRSQQTDLLHSRLWQRFVGFEELYWGTWHFVDSDKPFLCVCLFGLVYIVLSMTEALRQRFNFPLDFRFAHQKSPRF